MKNYSRAKAGRGKTAYRTPSVFRYQRHLKIKTIKSGKKKVIYEL